MRRLALMLVLCMMLLPVRADGETAKKPPKKRTCESMLKDYADLAKYRQEADDPRCPAHTASRELADIYQGAIDRARSTMSTECLAKAADIMRPGASINVHDSFRRGDFGVAVLTYTNQTKRTLKAAIISCSAVKGPSVAAVGKAVASGPIMPGATRDLEVIVNLDGADFWCMRCTPTLER